MIGLLTGGLIFASALESSKTIGSRWILYFGHDCNINLDETIEEIICVALFWINYHFAFSFFNEFWW